MYLTVQYSSVKVVTWKKTTMKHPGIMPQIFFCSMASKIVQCIKTEQEESFLILINYTARYLSDPLSAIFSEANIRGGYSDIPLVRLKSKLKTNYS